MFITILSGLTVHLSPKVGTNQVLVSYLHSLSAIIDLHYQLLCPLNFQHPHLRDAETLRVTASHSHQPLRFISHNLQPPFLPDLRLQTAPPSGHVVVPNNHTLSPQQLSVPVLQKMLSFASQIIQALCFEMNIFCFPICNLFFLLFCVIQGSFLCEGGKM